MVFHDWIQIITAEQKIQAQYPEVQPSTANIRDAVYKNKKCKIDIVK